MSYNPTSDSKLSDEFDRLNDTIQKGFKDAKPSEIVKTKWNEHSQKYKLDYGPAGNTIHLSKGKETHQIAKDLGDQPNFTFAIIEDVKKFLGVMDKIYSKTNDKIDIFHGLVMPEILFYFFGKLKLKKELKDVTHNGTQMKLYFFESVNEWMKEEDSSCCKEDIIFFEDTSTIRGNICKSFVLLTWVGIYGNDADVVKRKIDELIIEYNKLLSATSPATSTDTSTATDSMSGGIDRGFDYYSLWLTYLMADFFAKLMTYFKTRDPTKFEKGDVTQELRVTKYDIICAIKKDPKLQEYLPLISFLIEGTNASIIYLNPGFDVNGDGCRDASTRKPTPIIDLNIKQYYTPPYTKTQIFDLCKSTNDITNSIINLHTTTPFRDPFEMMRMSSALKFNPYSFSDPFAFTKMMGGITTNSTVYLNKYPDQKINAISSTLIKLLDTNVAALNSRGYKCGKNSLDKVKDSLDKLKKQEEDFAKELREYHEKMQIVYSTNGHINPDNMSENDFKNYQKKQSDLAALQAAMGGRIAKIGRFILDLNGKLPVIYAQ
jgi:hypothetical protein